MIKYFLGIVLLFTVNYVLSQNPGYFEQTGDTIIFYLNCDGNLTTKDKATYKRIAFFEKNRLAFKGNVIDFYCPDQNIALKANYKNGLYEGRLTSYYKSGSVKETGNYINNARDSIWNFYYKSNEIEKKLEYSKGQQKLFEFYQKNGKPKFLDGKGTYKGYSNKDYSSCDLYKIKGELEKGIMVGRWTINFGYSECTEVFDNGKFIRGYETPHNRTYKSVSIINPAGFPYYENISFLNYQYVSNKSGFYWLTYNKRLSLEKGFLPELHNLIKENINTNDYFYSLIEFQIDNGNINQNSFKSITNDSITSEKLIDLIISLNKWDKTEKKVSFTIYLPVFWENEIIFLKPKDILKFN